MLPNLPTNDHLAFSRELNTAFRRNSNHPEWPDGKDLVVTSESRESRPDPIYIGLSRTWTRLTNFFSGRSRRPA
jgi:hypothetical protein